MSADEVFRYRDGIAIIQTVAFSTSLLFGIYFRYYANRIGSFCIAIFSNIRLVSASCMLASINNSHGVKATILICESLGIILLIFFLLELLIRINKVANIAPKWTFIVPQLLTYLDFGLSIGGYIAVSRKTENQLAPTAYTRAGMAIITVIFVYVLGIFVFFWLQWRFFGPAERRAVTGVGLCIPPMVVRLVYSLIFVGTGDMTLNAVKGNAMAYLFMTAFPEIAVVYMAIWAIVKIPPLSVKGEKNIGQSISESETEDQQAN